VIDNVIKTKPLTELVDPTTKTIKKLETKLVDKKISKISKPWLYIFMYINTNPKN